MIHLDPAGDTWAAYTWPPQVPDSVRVQVEDLWERPMDWVRNARAVAAPKLGETVRLVTGGMIVTGLYVHIRDFTGRVIPEPPLTRPLVVTLVNGRLKALTP